MISSPAQRSRRDVRTLFVSDVHLGSRHSQFEPFMQMLEAVRPRSLYLVGDILDGWRWPSAWQWKETYATALKMIEDLANSGTEVFYTPGNHDDFLRRPEVADAIRRRLPFLSVADEFTYQSLDGREFLVTHGDLFDVVEKSAQWLSRMSSWAYDTALSANWHLSQMFPWDDRSPYWLCASGKRKVKLLIRFLSGFESAILDHARKRQCQGVICGHLHTPAIVERDDMTYFNTGDWVENCTSLVEYDDGRFDIECFYPRTSRSVIRTQRSIERPLPRPFADRPVFAAAEQQEEPALPWIS